MKNYSDFWLASYSDFWWYTILKRRNLDSFLKQDIVMEYPHHKSLWPNSFRERASNSFLSFIPSFLLLFFILPFLSFLFSLSSSLSFSSFLSFSLVSLFAFLMEPSSVKSPRRLEIIQGRHDIDWNGPTY